MNKLKIFVIVLLIASAVSCSKTDEALKRDTFFSYVEGKTGVRGVVMRESVPMEGVEVYLYRNKKSNLRGPADFVDITDAAGNYFIDVPEGNYYIIARKRKSGKNQGPIRKGDYYSPPIYDPVIVKIGVSVKVDLELKQLFGSLIQQSSGQKETATLISGVVLDEKGAPLKGAHAFAYSNEDFKREPDYFSSETLEDGSFTIYLDGGGKYYLGARDTARGTPKEGELYGLYEGVRGSGIFIKTKEKITEIKIRLKRFK
ncbi:hypothetical protein ACFL2A_06450 [Thermodesulfobacteriota bacterium]